MKVGCLALYASHLQSSLVGAFTGGRGLEAEDQRHQPLGFEAEDAAGHVLMRRDRGFALGVHPHAQGTAGLAQGQEEGESRRRNGNVYDSGTPGVYYYNNGNRANGGTPQYAPVPVPAPCPPGGRSTVDPQNPYGAPRRRYPGQQYPDANAQNQYPYYNPFPNAQNPISPPYNPYAPGGAPAPPPFYDPYVPSGTGDDGEPTIGGEGTEPSAAGCRENVAGTYEGIVPTGIEAVWTVTQQGCSVIFRSVPDEGEYAGDIVADQEEGADIVHISGAEGEFDGNIMENGDLDFPTGPGLLTKQAATEVPAEEGTPKAKEDEEENAKKIKEDEAEHSPDVEEAKQEAEDAAEKTGAASAASTNNMDAEEEFVGVSLSDEEKTKVGGALFAAFVLGAAIASFAAFSMCRPKWHEHAGSNHVVVEQSARIPGGDGNAPGAQGAAPPGAPPQQ